MTDWSKTAEARDVELSEEGARVLENLEIALQPLVESLQIEVDPLNLLELP